VADQAVQDLLDREAIVAVCVRYATALDRQDWDLLRSCFAPDVVAEFEGIGTLEGYEAVEKACRNALEPLAVSQHLLGNHTVELDGDTARAATYFQAQHVRPGLPDGELFIVAGTYSDRFARNGEGWWITHRHLTVVWTDGNPSVLA
jgi:ketosteroid isomerase-like protein